MSQFVDHREDACLVGLRCVHRHEWRRRVEQGEAANWPVSQLELEDEDALLLERCPPSAQGNAGRLPAQLVVHADTQPPPERPRGLGGLLVGARSRNHRLDASFTPETGHLLLQARGASDLQELLRVQILRFAAGRSTEGRRDRGSRWLREQEHGARTLQLVRELAPLVLGRGFITGQPVADNRGGDLQSFCQVVG